MREDQRGCCWGSWRATAVGMVAEVLGRMVARVPEKSVGILVQKRLSEGEEVPWDSPQLAGAARLTDAALPCMAVSWMKSRGWSPDVLPGTRSPGPSTLGFMVLESLLSSSILSTAPS